MTCGPIAIAYGTTEPLVFRYRAQPLVYKTIEAKVSNAPLRVTITAHGMPDDWDVALTDVGYEKLEAGSWPPKEKDYIQATAVDANTIELNGVDLARLDGDWEDGKLAYLTPVDLASASAQLKIYRGATTLETIAADLDNVAKTISFAMPGDIAVGQYTYAAMFTDSMGFVRILREGDLEIYTPGSPPACH